MTSSEEIKKIVRDKYSEIAMQGKAENASSCCGATNCGTYNIMSDSYSDLEGYHPDADLGLGCGLPTEFAGIQQGDTVLDLGSGAGNDCFVARAEAGETGKVIGVDFTPKMLELARQNAEKRGFNNVEFRQGDIEALPFPDDSFDLVTGFNSFQYAGNAAHALREAGRVAKPDGMIVIMTWGEPAGMQAASLVAALKPLLPPPPPGAPGPFALSDETALRAFATAGGLTPGAVFDVATHWDYPDEATALRGLGSSGVAIRAEETSGRDALDTAHRAALAPFRQADGSFRIGASFRCLVATR